MTLHDVALYEGKERLQIRFQGFGDELLLSRELLIANSLYDLVEVLDNR